MAGEVAGFWSYVQLDNAADGGRVLSLARRLRDEYRLQTADEIEIFVDRESLTWGTEWAQRINEAIAGTTFFIPIITPSYFRSQACRNELLKFALEAKRLGLEQLLMPVYWVTVAELEDDPEGSTDEAISLVARYQWEDLREARLEDEDSSAFRKAVARLARELASRAAEVTAPLANSAVQIPNEGDLEAKAGLIHEEDTEPGFLDVAAAGEDASLELNGILQRLAAEIEVVAQLTHDATQQVNDANERNLGMRDRLAIAESLASRLLDPAEKIERLGHRYIVVLSTMDAAIHAFLDAAGALEGTEEAAVSRDEFLKTIQFIARSADEAVNQVQAMVEAMKESAKISRSLRVPLQRIRTGLQGMLDGQALIDEWGRRAAEIEEYGTK
jgi:TIR domain